MSLTISNRSIITEKLAMTNDSWQRTNRLAGLRRFAIAITVLNILGHTVLGFEQSWAQPLVSIATAYGVEILLELIDSWQDRHKPRFLGGGIGSFC